MRTLIQSEDNAIQTSNARSPEKQDKQTEDDGIPNPVDNSKIREKPLHKPRQTVNKSLKVGKQPLSPLNSNSILVYAPNRSAILVNPQGYNYARYVGFIEEGLADRYLPKKIESAEPIQEPIAMPVQEPIEVYSGNVIAFPTAKPVTAEDAPIKPMAIELYSKWVQDKISQGQAAKIIAFDDWLEIAMMALNAAIAL